MDKATHIAVPIALLEQIVHYLQFRPYKEVSEYIRSLETAGKAITISKEDEQSQAS